MKKTFFTLSLLLCGLLIFYACKKQEGKAQSNTELKGKVESWLDTQKSPTPKAKNANVDLLKANLNFEASRFESLNQNETSLIIPVNTSFNVEKKVGDNVIINLVVTLDQANNIKRGVLVLFAPSGDKKVTGLPLNTFQKLYNYKNLEVDGQFKFLSVTGRWIYQLEYKEGTLSSYGVVKTKTGSSNKLSNLSCFETYIVTTYYVLGIAVDETWSYVGTTCVGDNCDDATLGNFCSGEGGGGGGGESCCIPDESIQLVSSSTSQTISDECGLEGIGANGNPVKTCTHTWYYNNSSLLWYTWKYKSIETAELEKEGGIWKFKNVTHSGKSIDGTIPPCTTFSDGIISATPSISADRRQARVDLQYWISGTVSCYPWASPKYVNSSGSTTWNAN